MRTFVMAFCLALVLAMAPAGAAQAVTAKSLSRCQTYDTHKMCVTVHRSADGKVWASGYLDKRSGRSNLRYIQVTLKSRACQASSFINRKQKTDDSVWGDATARAATGKVAWDGRSVYKATAVGGWMRAKKLPGGAIETKNRRDEVIHGKLLSGC